MCLATAAAWSLVLIAKWLWVLTHLVREHTQGYGVCHTQGEDRGGVWGVVGCKHVLLGNDFNLKGFEHFPFIELSEFL